MREKLPKCLELSKILRIFAPSKVTFGYPGKFPERASRIRALHHHLQKAPTCSDITFN